MNGVTSPIYDMEMARLDQEIEKTGKQFYSALLGKKRRVKRKWLEISAMTNAHLLQTLPYRAMLGHVAKIAEERDKVIAEMTSQQSVLQIGNKEKEEEEEENEKGDDGDDGDDNKRALHLPNSKPVLVLSTEEQKEEQCIINHSSAQAETYETKGSRFLAELTDR